MKIFPFWWKMVPQNYPVHLQSGVEEGNSHDPTLLHIFIKLRLLLSSLWPIAEQDYRLCSGRTFTSTWNSLSLNLSVSVCMSSADKQEDNHFYLYVPINPYV